MKINWRKMILLGVIALVVIIAIGMVSGVFKAASPGDTDLSTVVADASTGKIEGFEVSGKTAKAFYVGEEKPRTFRIEDSDSLREILKDHDVKIGTKEGEVYLRYKKESGGLGQYVGLFINLLPIIFIVAILFFFLRSAQGANNQALQFGKSRARLQGSRPNVTFQDVAGVDEAKEELQEVVEFLKFPEKFSCLGARIPRGVLLVGPPGCGKTLLAKAVAGEAGVPFFSISGSEFVEMFVGVGASRVRDLFEQAKKNAPCIVFVDEIDAVGRHRGAGLGGSHDEREQTLNQILVEMDGFDTGTNVIVIAATNRPDILDPALLRPGRFDRQVMLDRPDIKGRKAILEVHAKGKPLDDADLEVIAKQTPGFTGADLANVLNEAAILAARRAKDRISMAEVNEAVDRVIAGPERKSRVLNDRERRIIAYHEAGHALVGYCLPNADPPYKISIVARGMAGGFTRFLPEEDRHLFTKSQLEDVIAAALGGIAAEEMHLGEGETTTGPQDDLEKATRIAREMVTRYAMSEKLGSRTFGRRQELVFLGKDIAEQRDYSEKVAVAIDDEVKRIVESARKRAATILMENRGKLEELVLVLLESETIEGDALTELLARPVVSETPNEAS